MTSTLLLFVVLAAATSVSHCADVLHLTADSVLKEVCVNGVSQRLHNASRVKYFDSIQLPANWNDNARGCISLEARHSNPESAPGVLGCITSDENPTAVIWKCRAKKGMGGSCCETCRSRLWKNKATKNMIRYLPSKKHRNKKTVARLLDQCKNSAGGKLWRWDNRVAQHRICCQLTTCSNLCPVCKKSGAGKCDIGHCFFGLTDLINPPPMLVCNYRCCVEVTVHKDGTHPQYTLITKPSDTRKTKVCGSPFCLMLLDVEKCDALVHFDFANDFGAAWSANTDQVNIVNLDTNYANVVYVDMQSHVDAYFTHWTPSITIGALSGTGGSVIPFNPAIETSVTTTFVSACITGYQGSLPTLSDVVMKP